MKVDYKMFTNVVNMGALLEYISFLNVCCIHFYYAHKFKRVNLKYILFNVLQWHRNSGPFLTQSLEAFQCIGG